MVWCPVWCRNSIAQLCLMTSNTNYLRRLYHVHHQRQRCLFEIAAQMFPAMKISPWYNPVRLAFNLLRPPYWKSAAPCISRDANVSILLTSVLIGRCFVLERKMAAATTGGLFGSGSTGFSFGSAATSTGFGTPTLGANTLGSNTLGASGFSAIKPFGASTTTSTLSTPFGQQVATTAGTTAGFKFGGLSSTTASTFSGFNTAKTASTVPNLGTFGQTSQLGQSTGFALGATPGLTSTSTGLNLGSGLFKPSTAATTTTTLLGSTPTAATGLGLGTSSGLGAFGGFNAVKTTAAASTTTSATLSGLGGTGTSTGGSGTGVVGGVASKQG